MKMNSVKITYIICVCIWQFLCVGMAMAAQIYAIPNQYWWTAFLIFMTVSSSYGATVRMNSWKDFGNV